MVMRVCFILCGFIMFSSEIVFKLQIATFILLLFHKSLLMHCQGAVLFQVFQLVLVKRFHAFVCDISVKYQPMRVLLCWITLFMFYNLG